MTLIGAYGYPFFPNFTKVRNAPAGDQQNNSLVAGTPGAAAIPNTSAGAGSMARQSGGNAAAPLE